MGLSQSCGGSGHILLLGIIQDKGVNWIVTKLRWILPPSVTGDNNR